jgi:hypothetical protein
LSRTGALRLIRENGRIPPELALKIYRNNVSGARTRALAATYPACFRILGEACFNSIAQQFVEHTPSRQPDLNRYGKAFSNFLDDWTHTREQFSEYRYLGDLAQLEWLCHTAYYAEDDAPFDFEELARARCDSHETLCFRPAHSIGLLQSSYPVMEIREANLSGNDAATVQAEVLPEYLVVSRPAFQPLVERVDPEVFRILLACREGHTLGHIINSGAHDENRGAKALPGLIRSGWITGVSGNNPRTSGGP